MNELHPDELFALERQLEKLKPDEVIWLLAKKAPYITALQGEVKKLNGYGKIEAIMEVRGGEIQKMQFISTATWLKEKSLDAR